MKTYIFTPLKMKKGTRCLAGHDTIIDAIRHGQKTKWLTIMNDCLVAKRVDATDMLRIYTCNEALRASSLWEMPMGVRSYLKWRDPSKRAGAHKEAAVSLDRVAMNYQVEAIRLALYASSAEPTVIIGDTSAVDTCSIMLVRMSNERELQQLL